MTDELPLNCSCIDCPDFSKCQKVSKVWRHAFMDYPGSSDQAVEKRIRVMQTQYRICHEKQATFQTFTLRGS